MATQEIDPHIMSSPQSRSSPRVGRSPQILNSPQIPTSQQTLGSSQILASSQTFGASQTLESSQTLGASQALDSSQTLVLSQAQGSQQSTDSQQNIVPEQIDLDAPDALPWSFNEDLPDGFRVQKNISTIPVAAQATKEIALTNNDGIRRGHLCLISEEDFDQLFQRLLWYDDSEQHELNRRGPESSFALVHASNFISWVTWKTLRETYSFEKRNSNSPLSAPLHMDFLSFTCNRKVFDSDKQNLGRLQANGKFKCDMPQLAKDIILAIPDDGKLFKSAIFRDFTKGIEHCHALRRCLKDGKNMLQARAETFDKNEYEWPDISYLLQESPQLPLSTPEQQHHLTPEQLRASFEQYYRSTPEQQLRHTTEELLRSPFDRQHRFTPEQQRQYTPDQQQHSSLAQQNRFTSEQQLRYTPQTDDRYMSEYQRRMTPEQQHRPFPGSMTRAGAHISRGMNMLTDGRGQIGPQRMSPGQQHPAFPAQMAQGMDSRSPAIGEQIESEGENEETTIDAYWSSQRS